MSESPKTGRLWVVATPLGNLGDITERAKRVLSDVDHWVVEDTRRSGRLREQLDLPKRPMTSYYDEVEQIRVDPLFRKLRAGEELALISDAGTPALHDPGQLLVDRCHEEEIPVRPVPGPSAPTAALSVSGFPAEPFLFQGYFPRKQKARRDLLLKLKHFPGSVVIFESPNRILDALAVMERYLGDRRVFVAREMTKQHEEYLRGPIREIRETLDGGEVRGEFTLVLEPGTEDEVDPEEYLKELLERGIQLKEAARAAAYFSEESRSDLYQKGLEWD